MQKFEHTTRIDQYVKLKSNGEDQLYSAACAGSPGWIRKHDHDKVGWPMVWIEWDKEHWSYNGEEDRWAIEAHFEPVEETMSEEPKPPVDGGKMMEMFAEFLKTQGIEPGAQAESTPPPSSEPEDEQAKHKEQYGQLLDAVYEQMKEADSFLCIFVDRQHPTDSPVPVLIPRVANFYLSPEGGLLLEAHLSKLAAMAHEEVAIDKIRQVLNAEDGPSES
jgi:hypothetical protein